MTLMNLRKSIYNALFWCFFLYAFYHIFFVWAPDFSPKSKIIFAGPLAGCVSLLYAAIKTHDIMLKNQGDEKMKEISNLIFKGAMTFIKKEYTIMFTFLFVVFCLIAYFIGLNTAICFAIGAIISALAGVVGMIVSTKTNARAANSAKESLNAAFRVAYSGGLVMGLSVVGLAMIFLPMLLLIFKNPEIINGFALGASSVALFARVGGGIYTKAADVGADLVGKVEKDIPEDDPRNPAVIADNVGDNVGDVAGMGADLFESYVGSIIASMIVGMIILDLMGMYLPLTLCAAGILSSVIGSLFVRTKENGNPMMSLQLGTIISLLLFTLSAYYLITKVFLPEAPAFFNSVLIGVLTGCILGFLTQYYTGKEYPPVKNIANSTTTGSATTVISGIQTGMISTFIPIALISFASLASFIVSGGFSSYNLGIWGVSLSAIGMLSTVGIIIAVDAYGPIADNAGGIAQMANLDEEVRKRTDKLDSVGNTTAAIGKGFAIGSAALTAVSLLSAFAMTVNVPDVDVLNPFVMVSVLFGASLPFLFSGLTMGAVGRAASKMVDEVRRQFRENPKILQGEDKPDYKKCIKISAKAAILEMVAPGLVAISAPLVVGFGIGHFYGKTIGAQSLCGMLAGAIATGVCLAIMMANSGGAWDNAKKLIEEGNLGGKGSKCHKCAVVGDTVGDPFKDTSGPSLNILIKLMTIVALVCAGLFVP